MPSIPSDRSFLEQFQRLAAEKATAEKAAEEEREKEDKRLEREASEQPRQPRLNDGTVGYALTAAPQAP
jgi:hypothetical protein